MIYECPVTSSELALGYGGKIFNENCHTHLVMYRQILHILSLSKQYLHYLLVRYCVNIKICNSFTVSTDQANLGPASLLMMVD